MGKPTIRIGENKGAAKLISAFVFATRIVQLLYFLNLKFPASSNLLCLYSLVCVRSVQKPHCWFSHDMGSYLSKGFFCFIFTCHVMRKSDVCPSEQQKSDLHYDLAKLLSLRNCSTPESKYSYNLTLYTVDATKFVTVQIDATFHEGRGKLRTVS